MAHILIVEARFYEDMADALVEGAQAVLDAAGHSVTRLAVPGVLEIPPAIKFAEASGQFDGYVALGVVIRGETSHYDIVCGESARGLMDLAMDGLALGNGIQTVENAAQAWARCRRSEKDKGGGAAAAALRLLEIKSRMQSRA
jgi:6,7-dimethyl-8-ribityllumazine synthase